MRGESVCWQLPANGAAAAEKGKQDLKNEDDYVVGRRQEKKKKLAGKGKEKRREQGKIIQGEAAEKGDHREKVVGKISNKLKKLLIIKNKKVSRELSQLKLSLKTNLIDFGFLKKNMLAIFPVYF